MIDDWKATRLSEMIDKLGGQKSFTDALILSRVIILKEVTLKTIINDVQVAALLLCLLVHQLGFALNW